jgi:hypothetical protein
MKYGRLNIVFGAAGLLLAGMGGLALGATFDTYSVKDGDHVLSIVRFYLREGHSHGMPISLFNLIIGSFIDRLALSDRSKRICSIAAIFGLMLPIGLVLKGASGADPNFPPVGMIGVIGLLTAASFTLIGAVKIKDNNSK